MKERNSGKIFVPPNAAKLFKNSAAYYMLLCC